jgi:hypothetical protein
MNSMDESDKQPCILRCALPAVLQAHATKRLSFVWPVVRAFRGLGPRGKLCGVARCLTSIPSAALEKR